MKQSIKLLEPQIEQFNHVAPYQINLLSNYKTHMHKQFRVGNHTAVRQEKLNSERTTKHLRQLLVEIESLRDRVKEEDLPKFDRLIHHSRQNISISLKQFQDFCSKLPTYNNASNDIETRFQNQQYRDNENDKDDKYSQMQLVLDEELQEQQRQEEMAVNLERITTDVQLVNEIFHDINKLVQGQKEHVDRLEDNIERTHIDVVNAEKQLARAAKLKLGMYPLTGALIGTIVGGPIGLLAGIKIGVVAALSGSILGYSGGKVLKGKQIEERKRIVEGIETIRTSPN